MLIVCELSVRFTRLAVCGVVRTLAAALPKQRWWWGPIIFLIAVLLKKRVQVRAVQEHHCILLSICSNGLIVILRSIKWPTLPLHICACRRTRRVHPRPVEQISQWRLRALEGPRRVGRNGGGCIKTEAPRAVLAGPLHEQRGLEHHPDVPPHRVRAGVTQHPSERADTRGHDGVLPRPHHHRRRPPRRRRIDGGWGWGSSAGRTARAHCKWSFGDAAYINVWRTR